MRESVQREWKVMSNRIDGKKLYIAYRIIDTSAPMHSGNIETYGEYSEDERAIEQLVDELNGKEATQ